MKKGILVSFLMFCAGAVTAPAQDFMAQQKRYPRVREAFEQKGDKMSALLASKGIETGGLNILFIAFKAEKKLEVWASDKNTETFRKLTEYNICASSGKLGPKRKKGDRQVPEGVYYIERFNPSSSYHLSLGIDYPNKADRIRSGTADPGGDIFIHGSCVTIGCLPMTDDKIKEIYVLAVTAKESGQKKIPVLIFPFRMDDGNMEKYATRYASDEAIADLWRSLKMGYILFLKTRKIPARTITNEGVYSF